MLPLFIAKEESLSARPTRLVLRPGLEIFCRFRLDGGGRALGEFEGELYPQGIVFDTHVCELSARCQRLRILAFGCQELFHERIDPLQ